MKCEDRSISELIRSTVFLSRENKKNDMKFKWHEIKGFIILQYFTSHKFSSRKFNYGKLNNI